MNTKRTYAQLRKPRWSPPAWLFGPVWTVLYIIIICSYGYTGYLYAQGVVPFIIVVPFILNIIFNVIYTPIQFGLKKQWLATLDIILVDVTLIWAMVAIYPNSHWVSWVNIPYLVWVCFATVLQVTITLMN